VANFILSLVAFSVFYYPLRLLKDNWVRLSLPHWWVYVAGVLSWATLLSLLGPPIAIGYVFANIVRSTSMGAVYEAGGVIFFAGIIANVVVTHRELLDWDHVYPFIRTSLVFANYYANEEDLFLQLEKKKIRDIYKETSGQELIEREKIKKELPHLDPETALKELEEFRSQPFQSAQLNDDIALLKNGETVDITDTFKINTFRKQRGGLSEHCSEMRIHPAEKCLSFNVRFTQLTIDATLSPELLFRVNQELHELLQMLVIEIWLKPFLAFFDKISVKCYRTVSDSFGLPQWVAFMKVEIALQDLRTREGKDFRMTDLHTIAAITMLEQSESRSAEEH